MDDPTDVRARAEHGGSLCPGEHKVYQQATPAGVLVRALCDDTPLAERELAAVRQDQGAELQLWLERTMADHERVYTAALVVELLDRELVLVDRINYVELRSIEYENPGIDMAKVALTHRSDVARFFETEDLAG